MTSSRKLSLEEVLDEFFFSAENLSPAMVLHACEAHPEHRADIMEFAALWSSYESSPESKSVDLCLDISEESVSRLQSFVLNRIHEMDQGQVSASDVEAALIAVDGLAGAKLRRAAVAAELGESTLLLNKILTKGITDVPARVLSALAKHLSVLTEALQRTLGPSLAGSMSYKASGKPSMQTLETWESAVRALPISEGEKSRLLALQGEGDLP